MAVTKLWCIKSKVESVANYDLNPLKTTYNEEIMPRGLPIENETVEPELGLLVAGINCEPLTAVEEFNEVKKKFGKEDGILAYHGYISFPNKDGLDPISVLSIAREVANEMWGENFQIILSVHTNTDTLHCHLLVNSVSITDGHKMALGEKNYYKFRSITDSVCKKYDLTVPVPHTRKPIDKVELRKTLITIWENSANLSELKTKLEEKGIKYCGKNYIRVKDGRYVKLSELDETFATLFDFKKVSDDFPDRTKTITEKKPKQPELPDTEQSMGRR